MADRNFTDDYLTGIKRLIHGEQHGRAFSESFNSRFAASGIDLGDLAFAQPAAFYGQTNMQNLDGNGLWRTFNMPTGGIVYYESMNGGRLYWAEGGPYQQSDVWAGSWFDGQVGQRMAAHGQIVALGELIWAGVGFSFIVKVSQDQGGTWTETALASGPGGATPPYPMDIDVAVDSNGDVYAVVGLDPGEWVTYKSVDGGESFNVLYSHTVPANWASYGATIDVNDGVVAVATDGPPYGAEIRINGELTTLSGYWSMPAVAIAGGTNCVVCVYTDGENTPTVVLRNGARVWEGPFVGNAAWARQWDIKGDKTSGYWIAAPVGLSASGDLAGRGDQVGVLVSFDDGRSWQVSPLPGVTTGAASNWSQMVDVYEGRFLVAHAEYDFLGAAVPLQIFTGQINKAGELEWTLIYTESKAYGYGYGHVTACRFTKE